MRDKLFADTEDISQNHTDLRKCIKGRCDNSVNAVQTVRHMPGHSLHAQASCTPGSPETTKLLEWLP